MKRVSVRKKIKDVWWRPYMVEGARFSENDIPFCPTTATSVPSQLLTYKEALTLYRKELRKGDGEFKSSATACFYENEDEFDSLKGIWFRSCQAYKVLKRFAGIITPDFQLIRISRVR